MTTRARCSSILLSTLGHTVVAEVSTGREAFERAKDVVPDVVLLDVHMPDGSGIEAAERITQTIPGVARRAVQRRPHAHAERSRRHRHGGDRVSCRSRRRRACSIRRFASPRRARKELLSARQDAESARQALENRKTIERAKGILMRRTGSSEQEAYRILQRTSQDRSVPMVEIARRCWPASRASRKRRKRKDLTADQASSRARNAASRDARIRAAHCDPLLSLGLTAYFVRTTVNCINGDTGNPPGRSSRSTPDCPPAPRSAGTPRRPRRPTGSPATRPTAALPASGYLPERGCRCRRPAREDGRACSSSAARKRGSVTPATSSANDRHRPSCESASCSRRRTRARGWPGPIVVEFTSCDPRIAVRRAAMVGEIAQQIPRRAARLERVVVRRTPTSDDGMPRNTSKRPMLSI